MTEWLPIFMFAVTFFFLLFGYPVAFSLSGTALIFATIGWWTGHFDMIFLSALPERIFGITMNETLIAIPLFIFMGVTLERSKISEVLLDTMARLFGGINGGLGISVCIVGGLLAASTGIVGATVVTMGLISLPTMLKRNYSPNLSTGIICASGTLGQIIPPSIVLVILGDVMSSAYSKAQLDMGIFSPKVISVGDLFVGALIPGLILILLYIAYVILYATIKPELAPEVPQGERLPLNQRRTWLIVGKVLLPPIFLIICVLGSILAGIATPTEAASVGSMGGLTLTLLKKQLNLKVLKEIMEKTTEVTAMILTILIGASLFSLVFRGYEGDEIVREFLVNLGGGVEASFFIVMLIIFLLGFFLDFFEITFVVVPVVGPVLLSMGLDPIWLGIMIAVNLQTSFLTPPFGFALFYLRGVAPDSIQTTQIYRGVIPFIVLQLFLLILLWYFPKLVTWLPEQVFGS